MEPVWYYSTDGQGEYITVYADANNSSSKRRFALKDGTFVDEAKGGAGSCFAEAFSSEIRSARRLGGLLGRPNLQDAVRKGRLPSDVLSELRRLKKAMVR
jgi:hypothetical protein